MESSCRKKNKQTNNDGPRTKMFDFKTTERQRQEAQEWVSNDHSIHPSIYPFDYSSTCLPLYTLDFLLECVLYNVICDVLSSEVLWDVTLANDTNDLGGFLFFAFSSLSVCSRKMDPSTTTTKQEPARKQQEQHRKHNATREPRGTKGRKGWLVPRTFSFGEPLAVNRRRQGSKIQERLTQRSEYITV